PAPIRASGCGQRRNHHPWPVLCARRKKRIAALALRHRGGAPQDMADSRRAGGGAIPAGGHQGEVPLGCSSSPLFGHSRRQLTKNLARREISASGQETFSGLTSSI